VLSVALALVGTQLMWKQRLPAPIWVHQLPAAVVIGIVALAAILYLMIFKPPLGLRPTAAPPAATGCVPKGTTVKVSAQGTSFDTDCLAAPAGKAFTIAFDNEDQGVTHNVAIHQGSPTGNEVFKGEIFPGPKTVVYKVPALPAGTFGFVCSVHPNMTGTLTVQ
jgi:plastocyanin